MVMNMLAVVLSGGGAKGAYELGVWKALKKLHIKYDIVTGTSIGALNGMMMVQKEYYKCLRLWKNINYDTIFENFKKVNNSQEMYLEYLNKLVNGGIDTSKIEQLINNYYKPQKLYNSKIKYGIVSYNLTKKSVVYSTKLNTNPKKLKKYILASATCFPVFKPTKINNQLLVDGGYYDNLPINLAIDLGATEIIAVDLRAIGIKKSISNKDIKITYIKPNNKLDSFLMFDSNVTKRMINLGYNDALKKFNKLDGKIYTFKKGTLDNLYSKYITNMNKICENYFKNFDKIDKKDLNKIVENCLEIFKLDVDKIYDSYNIKKLLFEKLQKTEIVDFDNYNLKELRKILDSAKFVKYIYIKLQKCDKINPLFKVFFKEYMVAIYLSSMGR